MVMLVAPVLEFSVIIIIIFNVRRSFAVTVALIFFVFVLLIIVIYLNFA
jgi:hypothetical protein